jgi:hypothetical protein
MILNPGYAFSMTDGSFWKWAQFWQIGPELRSAQVLKDVIGAMREGFTLGLPNNF